MTPKALVVGDVAVTITGGIERLPVRGENVVLTGSAVHTSGVGSNVAINLAALGVEVYLASAVGVDPLGDAALATLREAGVGVDQVQRRTDASTGTMLLMIDPAGERTMVGTRGAAERFDLDPDLLERTDPDWLHVSGYTLLDEEMAARCERLVDGADARAIPRSVDLEGIAASGRPTPLDRATVFCNREEYRAYAGQPQTRPGAPLVMKLGGRGCLLIDGDGRHPIPTMPVPAVDSTGAGDAFDAAFIVARLRGLDAETSCRWGNAAGGLKVRTPGPRTMLSVEAIEATAGSK